MYLCVDARVHFGKMRIETKMLYFSFFICFIVRETKAKSYIALTFVYILLIQININRLPLRINTLAIYSNKINLSWSYANTFTMK